jgi:hypothetical protein
MTDCKRFSALAIGALLLAACGNDLSGTYADDGNMTAYEFHADGRATISVLGTTVNADYTLDDDKVLITSAQGTVVLRRSGEHLYGPMGLELTRRSDGSDPVNR